MDWLARRRADAFRNHFRFALGTMTAAAGAGLPLIRVIKMAAGDERDPAGRLLNTLADQMAAGPAAPALAQFASAAPIPEAKFLAFALHMQHETGAALTHAMASLSAILSGREKLAAKIQVLSAEARMSALLVGAAPFAAGASLFIAAPGYLAPFWETDIGCLLAGAALAWMVTGVFVMRWMTRTVSP